MRDKHRLSGEHERLFEHLRAKVMATVKEQASMPVRVLIVKAVVYGGLMALCYAWLLRSGSPVALVAAYVMYGLCALLVAFNFAHDMSHGALFRRTRLDNAGFVLIYTLLGAHAQGWKRRHTGSHHFAPNVQVYDADLQITGLIRVVPGSWRAWFHRYQHIYAPLAYTTYSLYWVFIKDPLIHFGGAHGKARLKEHVLFWGQKAMYISYILLVPMIFSGHGWAIVLWAFLCMHAVQSLFLLFTFFISHHVEGTVYFSTDRAGTINATWLANQVGSSNDFHPFSRFANAVFGGFNNHVAHHLFPHVCHVHYPAMSRILHSELKRNGFRVRTTTYWGGIVSHLRHLRNMGLRDS